MNLHDAGHTWRRHIEIEATGSGREELTSNAANAGPKPGKMQRVKKMREGLSDERKSN
jgi:hypothetical protein